MDSVLHAAPITRQLPEPLTIGYTDYVFYGDVNTEDDEHVGMTHSRLRLGAPLQQMDCVTQNHIPLVKTFECAPDYSRDHGHVYSENIYFVTQQKKLIPVRSKIRTGTNMGLRFNHVPSLNVVRENLASLPDHVIDPRSEIVSDPLLHHHVFKQYNNHPLQDWLTNDLANALSKRNVSELSLTTQNFDRLVYDFTNELRNTSSEVSQHDLTRITKLFSPEYSNMSPRFLLNDPIVNTFGSMKASLIPSVADFSGFTSLNMQRLVGIERNPFAFRNVAELFDQTPMTDFNVDIVIDSEGAIRYHDEHVVADRLSAFDDSDLRVYEPDALIDDWFNSSVLDDILQLFLHHHSFVTDEIADLIGYHAIKIKLIKTISDEALILLYRYNSGPGELPLCGVYFDLALQSLAPLSVMALPSVN